MDRKAQVGDVAHGPIVFLSVYLLNVLQYINILFNVYANELSTRVLLSP